jgi:membrane fusion protein, multidrug efflux system
MVDTTLPISSTDESYRRGYREGFGDGFEKAKTADESSKKTSARGERDGAADRTGEESKKNEKPEDKDDKDGKGEKPEGTKERHDAKPLYRRPGLVLLALAILLALIIVAIVFWRHSRHHESTDDAFIDGNTSVVSSQVGGRVVRLLVNDNQFVHAGELLLEIDSRDNDSREAQARAQLADAQSQLATAHAQVEVRRAAALQAAAGVRQSRAEFAKAEQDAGRFRRVDPDAVARQQADAAATAGETARAQLDAANSTLRSAQAQTVAAETQVRTAQASIDAAQAVLSAAQLQVGYARVLAPIDGRISRRSIDVGNVIAVGQSLMSIVSDSLWVTANYKETQLTRMRPGQAVQITVDAFPQLHFRAHVDSIQRGTGSYFSLLPAENATGNFVKVTQRVPVKIVFDDDQFKQYAIGPGMSVTPNVTIP